MKKIRQIIQLFLWVGFSDSDIDYVLENPYVLYTALAKVHSYKQNNSNESTSKFHRVTSIECAGQTSAISLEQIVSEIEPVFSYVDPKILRWFGNSHEQAPFKTFEADYYQSLDNLSHRQATKMAKDAWMFKTFSLGQALFLSAEVVMKGLLDWPRKSLIIYVTETYEEKPLRVLAYRYDNGDVEVYVNQMDPGDVWTPGVSYLFDTGGFPVIKPPPTI